MFVEFCNLCQKNRATGVLTGHFENLPEEVFEFMACSECAEKSMPKGD